MDRLLQSYLGQIKVGEPQTHKSLTAYPVLSSLHAAPRDAFEHVGI